MSPRRGRESDAKLDAMIRDHIERDTGVIEPDQPTDYSHAVWMKQYREKAYGEFTAEERHQIRAALGLGPWAETTSGASESGAA